MCSIIISLKSEKDHVYLFNLGRNLKTVLFYVSFEGIIAKPSFMTLTPMHMVQPSAGLQPDHI